MDVRAWTPAGSDPTPTNLENAGCVGICRSAEAWISSALLSPFRSDPKRKPSLPPPSPASKARRALWGGMSMGC